MPLTHGASAVHPQQDFRVTVDGDLGRGRRNSYPAVRDYDHTRAIRKGTEASQQLLLTHLQIV